MAVSSGSRQWEEFNTEALRHRERGEVRECESARMRELGEEVAVGSCSRQWEEFNTETSYNVSTPKFDNFSIENFSLFFSIAVAISTIFRITCDIATLWCLPLFFCFS